MVKMAPWDSVYIVPLFCILQHEKAHDKYYQAITFLYESDFA